jgi:hypothetical protein
MACSKFFSFAEVVQGRDANVPLTDNMLHAVKFVMVFSGKDRNNAGRDLRDLPDETFLSSNFVIRKLPGKGCGHTKLVSFEHAIELIMVLPGRTAKQVRKQFRHIIVRYLDGDRSMCREIEANHAMGKVKSYSNFASNIMNMVDQNTMLHAHTMPPTFYIYATQSPAFPGLIKIGKTVDVANRLSSLNTSCAPAPHVIVGVAQTFDKDRDEREAHAFFSSARREGEFFQLEDKDVLDYFATHITAQYNIELAQNIARLQGLCVK